MILAIVIFCFGPPIYYIGYIYIYASLNKHQGPGRSSAASRQSTIVFSHGWLGCFAISWARKKEHDARWIVKLNQSNTYICLKNPGLNYEGCWDIINHPHARITPRTNPCFFHPDGFWPFRPSWAPRSLNGKAKISQQPVLTPGVASEGWLEEGAEGYHLLAWDWGLGVEADFPSRNMFTKGMLLSNRFSAIPLWNPKVTSLYDPTIYSI